MITQEFYKTFKKDRQEAFNKYEKLSLQEKKDLIFEMIAKGINTCREYLRLKNKKDRGNIPVAISKNLKEKAIFFMEFFESVQHEFGEDFIKEKEFGEEYWRKLQDLKTEKEI